MCLLKPSESSLHIIPKKINFVGYRLLSNPCFSVKQFARAAFIAGATVLNPVGDKMCIHINHMTWSKIIFCPLWFNTLRIHYHLYIYPKVSGDIN